MTGPLIAVRAVPSMIVRQLTAKARRLAEARLQNRKRRWNSPRALWPLFTAETERRRHA